ncbi:serine/threonine protein kinase [Streptosporangium becharense]|uniref:Serine/threonine protein kinase n=1 Tax=Streptosporangium becharense TaxID=1816182 RepID=A0A7W9MGL1_9ACTN|nr:class III lanthionine synthetase LanKC [Streptosporangium becharense]MBB2914947.1 serine/threonine protein kinase [Streptosporangium becharense]MBB5820242.1 serine/threonine protein kinase [Streptosporangium becharense]
MDDAVPQLLVFCQADRLFFEPVSHIADRDTRFPAADRPLPNGWRSAEEGLWVVLQPPGVTLPDQGWKIHVSATDADAGAVCDLVVDFCLGRNLAMKFLRSRAAARLLNSKYADRGSSGKLITLYPADEDELSEVLPALAATLRGFTGPYILSDLRYEDSPVYVRYGAFHPMRYADPNGDPVYAVRTPDGRLVPDDRSPVFTVPEWVRVPEVLRGSLAKRDSGDGEEFPYQIERPLHFSNGGGVYLARDAAAGGYVVLLEARPHAGLDGDGVDAVARLAHERDVLERLDGLDCVPRVLDHRVIWEHHFLVEEYIDGATLMEEVFARYPLVGPGSSAESTAAYVEWATDVLAKVDHALMSVHAKGVRLADLHPGNIIVRPDGRVALIDFEVASDLDDLRSPGLAAPGFAAPAGLSGRAADDYAMNCLRQWVFLPISPLQDRDPVKLSSLTDVIAGHFPVPPGFGARMVRRFEAAHGPLGEDGPARMFDVDDPDWPAIRDSLVAGITASATPEREDRLFPGDPQQFVTGGFNVAYGAAGVLWALHQAGAEVSPDHVDWLVAAARRDADPRPGLLDGLHGVAAVLESLGRRDDALDMLDRARKLHDGLTAPGIHSGLAGAGLSLLHFSEVTGDGELRTEALDIGERLAAELGDDGSPMFTPQLRTGLQRGLTGVGHYFLRLHDLTGDPRHLDLAGQALRREIDRGHMLPDGTFQLLDGNRYHAYLGTGSSGLALVLSQYLARRAEPDFEGFVAGARLACRAPFIRHPFLFMGRAGTIAALHLLGLPEDRPVVRDHVRRLAWHALSHEGHLAFPGNQLLRLSMDLATGSAGVLAALGVAFNQNASIIPVLDLRSSAVEEKGRR